MTRPCGLARRPPELARRLAAERPYHPGAAPNVPTVIQPIFALHDQAKKPSCTAQALISGIEPHVGVRLSSVGPWTDARRRAGDLYATESGTLSHDVIDSVIARGVEPYVHGEDVRSIFEDAEKPALQSELRADTRRISVDAVHRTIVADHIAQIADSLWRGYATTYGGGLRAPYFSLGIGEAVTAAHVGGDEDGHARHIFGWIAADDPAWPADWRGCVLEQNSWPFWGGVILPCAVTLTDGTALPRGHYFAQCALVRPEAVLTSWEIDALEVRLAT